MLMNNNEYLDLVQTIKQEIQQAQYKATLSVNKELIMLYYNIGKIINEHKSWGNKFIENLAADIKLSFPNAKGYSVRNLKYMSKFASTYPDEQFVQTVSAQIPWSHNVAILDKTTYRTEYPFRSFHIYAPSFKHLIFRAISSMTCIKHSSLLPVGSGSPQSSSKALPI